MTLHELGWRGDAPPTPADSVGRVAVKHRNGYVVYTEAGEVAAEVADRLERLLIAVISSRSNTAWAS
jgi:hypothetical protein